MVVAAAYRDATMTIEIADPPPRPQPTALWSRLLPVAVAVAMTATAALLYRGGMSRNPMLVAFPVMMLASAGLTVMSGRRGDLDADRRDYLDYLSGLRATVCRLAGEQRAGLLVEHPDPRALWTLEGADRGHGHPGLVRVGIGPVPLATPLVGPRTRGRTDPVTAAAVRSFLDAHSRIVDAPITIALGEPLSLHGEPEAVRALLRAIICQLAHRHGPHELALIGVFDTTRAAEWEWLKWLPHQRDPHSRVPLPARVVMVVDGDGGAAPIPGGEVTRLSVGGSGPGLWIGPGNVLRRDDSVLGSADQLSSLDALVCARRLAGCIGRHGTNWEQLSGIDRPDRSDVNSLWRNGDGQLRVAIGTTADGAPLDLCINEAAEGGMGPHGLCVGATGSGKSELLRTIVLGMIARHSPDEVNLVLVDFKGGATFLGFDGIRHIAALITNLADAEPLVTRMRDALSGEITRRQELLRTAGCAGVADYRAGGGRAPLPTLLIIVDEFSELLHQHPDFVDMFVTLGRLGRSLGMHLLLASQRVDEGRLRGLESHLSYRICLKTLSAAESRIALGSAAAYELPATPGAGYLRAGSAEPTRFQAGYVSGPAAGMNDAAPRLFTSRAPRASSVTVLESVVGRLAGHGSPAHQVWLPPLGAPSALGELLSAARPPLRVPIGVVDQPLRQQRTPLLLDLSGATGNVAVLGGPQAGKSTALCTVIAALASTHAARDVQFYCLDFGGGLLQRFGGLPHVGQVASAHQPELVSRTIAELEYVIAGREDRFPRLGISSMAEYRRLLAAGDPRCADERFGDVFLVIDGWARLRRDFEPLESSITGLAAAGLSYGVHVMVAAARWAELRPALRDQLGTRIELRLGDPADSELDRRCAQQVPLGVPGRGLTEGGLHMLIADPSGVPAPRDDGYRAPGVRVLPGRVERADVLAAGDDTQVLLGLDERELSAAAIDFDRQPHLMVLGDAGSGKTSVLRMLCAEIIRTDESARLIVVDYRRSLLGVTPGGYAASAPALAELLPGLLGVLRERMPGAAVTAAQLRDRSWWSGPQLYLVVDDYELVGAGSPNPLAPIVEFLPYAGDLGFHMLLARRTGGAARTMFDALPAALRDLGAMGLMLSGRPEDGPLFDGARPLPLPPGRGTLLTRGEGARRIQVGWLPP